MSDWQRDSSMLLCVGGPAHGTWHTPHLPDGSMAWLEHDRDYRYKHIYTQTLVGGKPCLFWLHRQVLGEVT